MLTSYPPPAIGGPVIPVNPLAQVVEQFAGHTRISCQDILDCLDKCIGTAQTLQTRLLWRQFLNPFWYIIEGFAYIVRIPFVILRRAGLPASVEQTVWAHFVKAVFLLVILGACAYFGIRVTVGDVLQQWLRH